MKRLLLSVLLLALAGSCSDDDNGSGDGNGDGNGDGQGGDGDEDGSADGSGDGSGGDGQGGDGSDDGCETTLTAIVRDFRFAHPDFENDAFMNESGSRGDMPLLGIVESTLGSDKKPVYTGVGEGRQTTSQSDFDAWYRDVEGVNQRFTYDIELMPQAGSEQFVYANSFFFPIDGQGFGNEGSDRNGMPRNFAFTTEIHTRFEYKGGERFTFIGDDDLWLFINGKLAIDLGGLHPEQTGTVDLDARAAELGITPGGRYDMDIFHAERHTTDSNFRIETTIGCIIPVVL